MRICSILTSLTSGGAETLVAKLSPEFVAAGHESVVVTLCDAVTLDNSEDMEAKLRRRIETGGGRVVSLRLGAGRGVLAGGRALRRLLGELQPDIIHSHTARALPMLAMRREKTPVILTHHNSRLSFPPILFRLFDRQVRGYVAISPEISRDLGKRTDRRIELIPNAAALDFAAEGPRDAPQAPATIISVGAVSEQKNYKLLIAAAAKLRERGVIVPMPRFLIAGGGARLKDKRTQVKQAGLEGIVEFLGERSDIPDLLRASDIYLNTSHYEGLSIAMLEAMASGLPIVATDVAGNRDLVQPDVNGLLAHAGNATELAMAIERILANPERYARLSAGSLGEAANYSIEEAARRHLAFYADEVAHPR